MYHENKFTNPPPKKKKAFTLVEVMITATLLAIIFSSVFSMLKMGTHLIDDARQIARISQILQSEVENLRAESWVTLSSMTNLEKFDPAGEYVKAYSDKYTCYRWIRSLNSNQKEILVYIFWDQRGTQKLEIFSTLFTRNGLNDYYYRSFSSEN